MPITWINAGQGNKTSGDEKQRFRIQKVSHGWYTLIDKQGSPRSNSNPHLLMREAEEILNRDRERANRVRSKTKLTKKPKRRVR